MPTCELRAPTLDDVDAVYALICELKQKAYDRHHFTAGFAMNLQNPTLRYQLAQVEGETVGLIGLQLQFPLNFNAWIGEVQELVVLPQRRGLHVGQALLAWAEQEARDADREKDRREDQETLGVHSSSPSISASRASRTA
mgnify:CR=1 FL=1